MKKLYLSSGVLLLINAVLLSQNVWVPNKDDLNLENSPASVKAITKLTAADGKPGDSFGQSVEIQGEFAFVGAHLDDNENGMDAGAVYIFKYDGNEWIQQQKITASDGAEGDIFGYSLRVAGNYLVVGAPWDDDHGTESGAAYMYRLEGNVWTQQQKLTASDGGEDNRFGIDVDMNDECVIIGAFFDDDFGSRSGSAYIFNREGEGWTEQEILTASDGAENDWFGVSVSIDNDYAAVGSRYDDNENGTDAGAIYIFSNDGYSWSEQQKLTARDGEEGDLYHVNTLEGGVLIAGAYMDDRMGSIYVYTSDETGWNEIFKFTGSVITPHSMFGCSLSLDGNRFAVGAYGDDSFGENSGAVYTFEFDGDNWHMIQRYLASGGNTGDFYGLSVSLDRTFLIVGARNDDEKGEDAGAAYIHELEPLPTSAGSGYDGYLPSRVAMQTVYPNPFNTATTITYSVLINISIYNTQGQKIKALVDRYQEAGTYSIQWKGEDERENQVPDGLYFCQINWDNFSQSIKLMLLK
jgi:hypothetical protein